MRRCSVHRANAYLPFLVLLLAGVTGSVGLARTPAPPPRPPADYRTILQSTPYTLANAQGDTIVVMGDSLSWQLPYETLRIGDSRITKVVPNLSHAADLRFAVRTTAKIGMLVRPLTGATVDTMRSAQALLAEYYNSPAPAQHLIPASWYPNATCTLPEPARYHIVWIAYGALDSTDSPATLRATGRVVGELIVDAAHNRFLWARGRIHAR
jgi:hypothetical protein